MGKIKFRAWIKKEMAGNGGLDNFVICHSDGSLEYTGEEELEKFISENIVNITFCCHKSFLYILNLV